MDISTGLVFFPEIVGTDIYPQVLSKGSGALDRSRKIQEYQASLREVFGLCVLANLRKFLEPEGRWVFTTEPSISDDGAVANLGQGSRAIYLERVEQVYLPGEYLKRDPAENINDYILKHVSEKKDKGFEYSKDTSLLILSDAAPNNLEDYFYWQEFVKNFYKTHTFLHVYLLSLIGHSLNKYHLLSFTNQKHRQYLNGQFEFTLTPQEIIDFNCIQKIDLLNPPIQK